MSLYDSVFRQLRMLTVSGQRWSLAHQQPDFHSHVRMGEVPILTDKLGHKRPWLTLRRARSVQRYQGFRDRIWRAPSMLACQATFRTISSRRRYVLKDKLLSSFLRKRLMCFAKIQETPTFSSSKCTGHPCSMAGKDYRWPLFQSSTLLCGI